MIVNTATTFDVTVGAPGRIPGSDDAQVVIPPTNQMVLLSQRSHIGGVQSAVELNDSAVISTSQSRTNQAAIQTTFITLGKGLWELNIVQASVFTFLGAVASFIGTSVDLTYQGNIQPLVKRLATIGGFTDIVTHRLLLNGQATLQFNIGLTGAGQSIDYVAIVNAVRVV